jgi:hypothetical protein
MKVLKPLSQDDSSLLVAHVVQHTDYNMRWPHKPYEQQTRPRRTWKYIHEQIARSQEKPPTHTACDTYIHIQQNTTAGFMDDLPIVTEDPRTPGKGQPCFRFPITPLEQKERKGYTAETYAVLKDLSRQGAPGDRQATASDVMKGITDWSLEMVNRKTHDSNIPPETRLLETQQVMTHRLSTMTDMFPTQIYISDAIILLKKTAKTNACSNQKHLSTQHTHCPKRQGTKHSRSNEPGPKTKPVPQLYMGELLYKNAWINQYERDRIPRLPALLQVHQRW